MFFNISSGFLKLFSDFPDFSGPETPESKKSGKYVKSGKCHFHSISMHESTYQIGSRNNMLNRSYDILHLQRFVRDLALLDRWFQNNDQ